MRFVRCPENPIIRRTPGTFFSKHAANPDLLIHDGRYLLYFRGQGEEGHDQIGVAYCEPERFDGVHWTVTEESPVIRVSQCQDDFDSQHILDPAAVRFNGQILLYYSGHSSHRKPAVGLAVSQDGLHFEKAKVNPVVTDCIAPEVVVRDELVHLFYQRVHPDGSFRVFCCTSDDGVHFDPSSEREVLSPSGDEDAFDRFSVSTVRIWRESGWYYMTYGGCPKYQDYPIAIGLARSIDLLSWERYPHNPVFERGEAGAWDEGALWFATVHREKDTLYLWYEGTGTGMGNKSSEAIEASKLCRERDYGGYASVSFSQIGLATYTGPVPKW